MSHAGTRKPGSQSRPRHNRKHHRSLGASILARSLAGRRVLVRKTMAREAGPVVAQVTRTRDRDR